MFTKLQKSDGYMPGNVAYGLLRFILIKLRRRERFTGHSVGLLGTHVSTWFQLHCFRYVLIARMAPFVSYSWGKGGVGEMGGGGVGKERGGMDEAVEGRKMGLHEKLAPQHATYLSFRDVPWWLSPCVLHFLEVTVYSHLH